MTATPSSRPDTTLVELLADIVMLRGRAAAIHHWAGRAVDAVCRATSAGEPHAPPSIADQLVELTELVALGVEHHDALDALVPTIWHVDTSAMAADAVSRFDSISAVLSGDAAADVVAVAVWLAEQQRSHATAVVAASSTVSAGPLMRVVNRVGTDLARWCEAITPPPSQESVARELAAGVAAMTARLGVKSRAISTAGLRN